MIYKIYNLNLHGNTRIKETSPNKSKDENVFDDIQQGVCICLFVRTAVKDKSNKIHYQDIWGLRKEKYEYLNQNNINTTKWIDLQPKEPHYFLKPKDLTYEDAYNKFSKLTEVFNIYSSGIETEKDKFAVDFDKQNLKNRLQSLRTNDEKIASETFKLKEYSNWTIK